MHPNGAIFNVSLRLDYLVSRSEATTAAEQLEQDYGWGSLSVWNYLVR